MPDRLRKINYNRTTKYINNNIWFSIHSSTIERTLFKEDTTARTMFKFPYSVPNLSEMYVKRRFRCFRLVLSLPLTWQK